MKGKANASKKDEARLRAGGGGAGKRKKAAASGKPKRPPSAFFVFMSEFRQEYQAQHPGNKSVAAVSHFALCSPFIFFPCASADDVLFFRVGGSGEQGSRGKVALYVRASDSTWVIMHNVEEKQPYVDQAGQKKQDYEKTKANIEKESTSSKKAKTDDDDGSKSEVDDEDGGSDEDNDDDE
ncbi:high mobility group protein3 [Zea mays]|uniref:High mobility group protein3 n=1 Tax=Zea mays TaxID=4577 RepID=A0A1D6Q6U2_MAIZE|nr:high mobility group protein3 [Zea mays]